MNQSTNQKNGHFRHLRRDQGFSLVEVMLAIGVLACSVIPILGLMPHGVDALHVAIRQNDEAHVQQEILGRLTTTDWDATHDLADFDGSIWYFNDHGAPVKDVADALYTAHLEVSEATLPGAAASSYYVRTLVMKVTDLPAQARPFDDPNKYRRYVATVAKMDK